MSVCTIESGYRKSEKQAVKDSNCCLKRENKITDNDGMISEGNEKIPYQWIKFSQWKTATFTQSLILSILEKMHCSHLIHRTLITNSPCNGKTQD